MLVRRPAIDTINLQSGISLHSRGSPFEFQHASTGLIGRAYADGWRDNHDNQNPSLQNTRKTQKQTINKNPISIAKTTNVDSKSSSVFAAIPVYVMRWSDTRRAIKTGTNTFLSSDQFRIVCLRK